MSHMTKGVHVHCDGPTGHPLLVARRAPRGVRGEALFWDLSTRTKGVRGFEAEGGTVDVSCPCHPEAIAVDLAKVAEIMRTRGRVSVSLGEVRA